MRTLKHHQKGFAILEAVLAVLICGVMATGIVLAVKRVANLAFVAKREASLQRIVHNHLMAELTRPRIIEGKNSVQLDEWDIELETEITLKEDLQTQEGTVLNNIFDVTVRAVWWENNDWQKTEATSWRQRELYSR